MLAPRTCPTTSNSALALPQKLRNHVYCYDYQPDCFVKVQLSSSMSWWGKSPDKPDPAKESKSKPDDKTFDPDKLPAAEKLPKTLQEIVDKSDKDSRFFDDLVDG